MHEYSLIEGLFDILREEIEKRKAKEIIKIELEVGKLSGAEPLLLKEAFKILKKGTEFENTELNLKVVEPLVICSNCKKEFSPDIFPFECPYCGEFGGEIIKGDKIFVKSLEILED